MSLSKPVLLLTLIATPVISFSQPFPSGNAYDAPFTPKEIIPYPYLREADVMWRKRVWQYIDVKQKINLPLRFVSGTRDGISSLWTHIVNGLMQGNITAYDSGPTMDDEFHYPLSIPEISDIIRMKISLNVPSLETGDVYLVDQVVDIETEDIVGYKIKEDWIFDKQRSAMTVRIIGIAPVCIKRSESGEVIGTRELFWLYFPECRYWFVRQEAFNAHNDEQRISYDDIFMKRFFSSYIIKEDNVYNRAIEDYMKGLDGLIESERIKEKIFVFEHDLWQY